MAAALVDKDCDGGGKAGRRFGGLAAETWGLNVTDRGGLVAMGDEGAPEVRLELWRRGVVSDGVAVVADAIVLCSEAQERRLLLQ